MEKFNYENQKLIPRDIEREMKQASLDYAMSVIVGRALPDARDGLKPVHRRILYAMYEKGLTPDKPFRKAATTVGDVLGSYHPHGELSVYDALVRMAQHFSLRYTLVEGHGNFGSVDGDPPAAMRYTEARMARLAMEMMADIEKETVDFQPNYDNHTKEPVYLPSRFPNLLVNGSVGIAVAMATNIPPHNLREVIDACLCVIDNPEADLGDLMEHIKGPDFPTKGQILGMVGIRAAYATGKGRVKIRAVAEIEEHKGRNRIVVTEIPYMVNKAKLIIDIAELVKSGHIDGISGIRDESSSRAGMKIVIDLKRDANPSVTLNKLYAMSQMQTTFAINMVALDDRQPKTMSLRQMLDCYIAHQKEVVTRRTRFDLRKARERAHILEGYRIALDNIDEVIRIIRTSYNNAKERLIETFSLSEIQAAAILDMRLARLQGLEREKIDEEYGSLMAKIDYYLDLLAHEAKIMGVVKDELTAVREKFGDDRRTVITPVDDEIDIEDLIDREDCVYTLTHFGYIKRLPSNTYRAQRRGGRGITGQTLREEDFPEVLFTASTHDTLLFFTNLGRLYRKKGYHIPEASRQARGLNIANLLPLDPGEKVTAMIPLANDEPANFLTMITAMGTIKRTTLEAVDTARKGGIRAITLEEGDELISVRKTAGDAELILATRNGYAICFKETDVRSMGRAAMGVRGIRLAEGDRVIGAARVDGENANACFLTVTQNGYGKRTPVEDYRRAGETQKRGGKGLRNYQITEKTGPVAAVKVVQPDDDVLLISDDGIIIRMAVDTINVYSRVTQGVILMRLQSGASVIGVARTAKGEEEEAES
jgi:DNA gyrase subunit A